MNPKNLQHQISAVRDLLSSARNDDVRACVEAAIKTLEWLSKGDLVLKEMMRLRREDPELFELLRELIGAGLKLDQIRRMVA